MKRHFCASAFIVDPYTKKILLIKQKNMNTQKAMTFI